MQKTKKMDREERIDFTIGLVTVLVILALFVWMIVSVHNNVKNATNANVGEISAVGELRRGSEQTFTYDLSGKDIADGTTVTWDVNGQRVSQTVYTSGQDVTLNYTPTATGELTVGAKVGKYSQTITCEVLPPCLTVTTPSATIVYGDELPKMRCNVQGFVEGDDTSDFCYDDGCVADCDRLDVGVYQLKPKQNCCYMDYEVTYNYGSLTVLPRHLEVSNRISKTYDGTNTVNNPTLNLEGVIEGDDVSAQCETLYFDNKNVGNEKTVVLANVKLVGKNAYNYVLPDFATGEVSPKSVDVTGLTVKSKLYDGTTRATIDKMGTLDGVCKGDSVAIGKINVSFESANVGTQNVIASDIVLVGADKDNYVVRSVTTDTAEINDSASFWDKIMDRQPIAQGAN